MCIPHSCGHGLYLHPDIHREATFHGGLRRLVLTSSRHGDPTKCRTRVSTGSFDLVSELFTHVRFDVRGESFRVCYRNVESVSLAISLERCGDAAAHTQRTLEDFLIGS